MTEEQQTYVPSVAEVLGEMSDVVATVEDAYMIGTKMIALGVPEDIGTIQLDVKGMELTLLSAGIALVMALTDFDLVRESGFKVLAEMREKKGIVEDSYTPEQEALIEATQRKLAEEIFSESIQDIIPDTIPEDLTDGGLGSA